MIIKLASLNDDDDEKNIMAVLVHAFLSIQGARVDDCLKWLRLFLPSRWEDSTSRQGQASSHSDREGTANYIGCNVFNVC